MERKISFADVQQAVDGAYEQFKSLKEGTADPRIKPEKENAFGISVVLTDGRRVDKADTDMGAALGNIAKVPVSVVLMSQNTPEEMVKRNGTCTCQQSPKPTIPFSLHGIKAVSAVAPQNDPEGKYGIILETLLNMTQGEPELDDALFETLQAQAASDKTVDKIDETGYKLFDDTALSVRTWLKLSSLRMTTAQLATLGATIAADGRNPISGTYAFDGANAAAVTTLMAASGKGKRRRLMLTGLPCTSSFSGAYLAVMPGFGAIAVYSPELDDKGNSVKGLEALEYIAKKLGLNVFASARVSVE